MPIGKVKKINFLVIQIFIYKEYVDLYVKHLLDILISRQFSSFQKGFISVFPQELLGVKKKIEIFLILMKKNFQIFRPEELEMIICGTRDPPDFHDLQAVTKYEGGFHASHPVIKLEFSEKFFVLKSFF